MNGQTIKSNTGRTMMTSGAFAAVALLGGSLITTTAAPAMAQDQKDAAISARDMSWKSGPSSMDAPGSVQPIITRIAAMLQGASKRSMDKNLPAGSRESYGAAATALRQALAKAHVRPNGARAGFEIDTLLSPGQLSDDISQLRATAGRMSGPRAADMNEVAVLYATGAKEFFTGSLREALLSSGTRLASNNSAHPGVLGITTRRPNTTIPVTPMPNVPIGGQAINPGNAPGFTGPDFDYSGLGGGGVVVGNTGTFGGDTVVVAPGGVSSIPPTVTVPVGDNTPPVVPTPPVVTPPTNP